MVFHPHEYCVSLLTYALQKKALRIIPRCLDYVSVKAIPPRCHTKTYCYGVFRLSRCYCVVSLAVYFSFYAFTIAFPTPYSSSVGYFIQFLEQSIQHWLRNMHNRPRRFFELFNAVDYNPKSIQNWFYTRIIRTFTMNVRNILQTSAGTLGSRHNALF